MRIGAAIVALVAVISLVAQSLASAHSMPDAGLVAVAWRMLGYFTILANTGTALVLARAAMTGRISSHAAGAVTVIMLTVGLTFHVLLAGLVAHQGLDWWADRGLHAVVPVLTALWWLALGPKAGLTARDALTWLVWPLAYAAYALARGALSGFWPYPFIDVSTHGWPGVALNVAGLAIGFALLGLGLVALARRLAR
jgi:uncharacterized protein YacL